MIAKMYMTTDNTNRINKELTFIEDVEIKFKDDVNLITPVILLKFDDLINFNYVYLDKFKRYYFIEDVEIYPNKIYNIRLVCDVLMSFKNDILNSYGNITTQTTFNPYYDSGYNEEIRKEIDIYNSNVTLIEDEKSVILATIGG